MAVLTARALQLWRHGAHWPGVRTWGQRRDYPLDALVLVGQQRRHGRRAAANAGAGDRSRAGASSRVHSHRFGRVLADVERGNVGEW